MARLTMASLPKLKARTFRIGRFMWEPVTFQKVYAMFQPPKARQVGSGAGIQDRHTISTHAKNPATQI